jgi:hypothetical protein
MFIPVVTLLVVVVLLLLFATATSYIIMKRNGGTMEGGIMRVQAFVIYVFMSLSLLSQVSRVCLGNLPEYMNAMAMQLAIFQLDVVGPVSPDCTDEPFLRQIILFDGSVVCMAILGVSMMRCVRKSAMGRKRVAQLGYIRQFLITWLCLSYSLMTNFVSEALYCTQNANGEYVMGSNPLVLCYVGKHTTLFASAVFALVFHGLMFPMCSALIIYHIRKKHLLKNDKQALAEFDKRPMWKYFLSDDYKPHLFWFRHIELALFFTTTICNVILVHENIHGYLAGYVAALVLTIGMYWKKRPFSEANAWRLHVRNSLSLCSILYVFTNYCSSPISFDGNGQDHVSWLAPIAMASSVLLFLVLIVSFVAVLLQGAKKESFEIQQQDERAIDSAASMFGPKGGAVVNPMIKGGHAFSNPLFQSRRKSTYRSKMEARIRSREKRSNILMKRNPANAEFEMVPVSNSPASRESEITNPMLHSRQKSTYHNRIEAHKTTKGRSKRSDMVPAKTKPTHTECEMTNTESEIVVPEDGEVEMNELALAGTEISDDAIAPQVEGSWTEHYDPHTKASYYECVRVSTMWEKSSSLDDETIFVEHVDASSGEIYFECRQRRVTWSRPASLGNNQLVSESIAPADPAGKEALKPGLHPPSSYTSQLTHARQNLAKSGERAKPPEGIKHTTTWWQLLDDEGHTCFLNRLTNELQYHQPSGWVKHLAREQFGGISRVASKGRSK